MSKSLVIVYHGGRGSGKTLSMTAEAVRTLVLGGNVWSNYPLWCDVKDENGQVKHLQSNPIEVADLLTMQRHDEIRNGIICLDELNLFFHARRAGALGNIIFNGVCQLIRKRDLTFIVTTQDFSSLDKSIRWQCDVTVWCHDLSFRYHNLPAGMCVSQLCTDWSGILTGREITDYRDKEERARNSMVRILMHGVDFFKCFSTGFEFNVLDIMSNKFSLQRFETILNAGAGDNGGFDSQLLTEYKDSLVQLGVNRVAVTDLISGLKDMGMAVDANDFKGSLGKKLKAAGFQYRQGRNGNFYEICA